MGFLGVEKQYITGAQGYCKVKPGKREGYNWTIPEEILGLHVGTDNTVPEIIVIVGLEIQEILGLHVSTDNTVPEIIVIVGLEIHVHAAGIRTIIT